VLLTTTSVRWECVRQSAATVTTSGWSFEAPAGDCPLTTAVAADAGVGLVSVAPGNLQSTVTGTTVRLSWNAIPETVTSFLVEAGSAPALANLARLNTGNAALVLLVDNVPGGVYYVRVRAIGPDGLPGPASNEIVVRVGVSCSAAPVSPTGLSAVVDGNRVNLTWIAPAGGDSASTYVVEAGSATTLSNIIVFDTGSAATQLTATAPTGLYYARVRGSNSCGIGGASNEFIVAIGTPAPPPTSPPPTPPPPIPGTPPTAPTPQPCSYSVSPTSVPLSAIAGGFELTVTTAAGCAWSAASSAAFASVASGGSSTGPGTARFSVTAATAMRTGAVRVSWIVSGQAGGQDVMVSQEAPPAPQPTAPAVETMLVVPAQSGVTNQQLIATPPPSTRPNAGGGPLLGPVTVSAGSTPSTVMVQLTSANGVAFNTVIVSAGDVSSATSNYAALGAPSSASHYVITLASPRTTTSLALTVLSGQPLTAQFAVTVNSELPVNYLAASIAVPCSYSLAGPTTPLGGAASLFNVTVNTAAGCAWTASSLTPSAISVITSTGIGPGTAQFSITANLTSTVRTGTIRIATQDFTVTQNPTATGTTIGDTVLIQGCAGVPLFPTDCTGAPFFSQQTVAVTADATDQFTFGVMRVNVQASSIIVTLQPGQGVDGNFNGVLVRGIDWVGMPTAFITGYTLTDNTMHLLPANLNVFENGHAVAINVGVASLTAGSVTINLLRSP